MQTAMNTDEEGLGVAKWPGKHAPAAARCLAGEEQQDGRRVGLQRTARAGQSSSSNRQNSTARASFTLHSAKLTLMASGADIAAAAAAARCCAGRSPAHSGGGRIFLQACTVRWRQLSGRLQLQPCRLAAQEAAQQEEGGGSATGQSFLSFYCLSCCCSIGCGAFATMPFPPHSASPGISVGASGRAPACCLLT
jgi:hypothetical protein